MDNLEQRINEAGIDKPTLITALLRPNDIGHSSYFKYQGTDWIEEFCREKRVRELTDLGKKLYGSLNKVPLKQVQYGMGESEDIPDELWPALVDWEVVYFLAGLWNKKSTLNTRFKYSHNLLTRQSTPLIIAETIFAGTVRLRWVHDRQDYKRPIYLPQENNVRQQYYFLRNQLTGRGAHNRQSQGPLI